MSTSPDASTILHAPGFLIELQQAANQIDKPFDQAKRYARKCLKEIEATPRDNWLRPAARLARFVCTRSYEAELDINLEKVEELRELSKDHLLLFLWSHKSHMDSFVFLLSLYENNFRPLPLIFAGVNMNFLGFGTLARRVGAIFLRRSFHEDPIYKLVFKRYIDFLISHQLPLSWSIEGTRSRTGKLSPPKLGVLNWVVESCHREQKKNVLLVPVSLAFDRIAEIDDYVAIQSGQPKRKESLRWFIDYIFGMRQPYGKVYIRYGEPLTLGAPTDLSQGMLKGKNRAHNSEVTRMAFEVCRRIEQITPIKSADVLAMVLLSANQRALTASEIHLQSAQITELVKQRSLPIASGFSLENEAEVRAAVLALEQGGLVKSFDDTSTAVYYIPRRKRLAAAYYRNTITHYFLRAAISEISLAMCALGIDLPGPESLRGHAMALRDLYKFEFFYKPTEAFLQDIIYETQHRFPNWDSGRHSVERLLQENPPRFGHAILRSISEGYLIIAVALLQLNDQPVLDKKLFTRQLLSQGRQMLLRKTVSCESSVSQDLFANGLRLAEHQCLLNGSSKELLSNRAKFARQVVSALSGINLLQRSYDAAWFPPLPGGGLPGLLEP